MNLSTNYLGLTLNNPLVVSSSKLTGTLDNVKACAKAGAGAVVLKSLFEEQISHALMPNCATTKCISGFRRLLTT